MKTRLSLLMVLTLLVALFPTPVTRAEAPATRGVALQGPETIYYVEWYILAKGFSEVQGSDYRQITQRKIKINGEAVYHDPDEGSPTAMPMGLRITDDWYYHFTDECNDDRQWRSITDPGRYTGGPDPFWSMAGIFWSDQAPDGTWSMDNPLSDWAGFVVNGQLERTYKYRTDQKWDDLCGSNDHTSTYTNDMMHYDILLPPLRDMPLIGDPTGTVFTLDTDYTVQTYDQILDIPLDVNFHATVRKVRPNCNGLAPLIDIANPALNMVELNLQAEDTTPDGVATLKASVTCQGYPVMNAPVVVGLRVQERSGGHNHTGGNRPRGYIDDVEQTANSKFIGLTDSSGTVTFAIRPGRDLTDKTRGIAGLYTVDAMVEWEGLTTPTKRATIDAHLDLVPMPKNDRLYRLFGTYVPGVHPKEHHGTPVTVQDMQEFAKEWWNLQQAHNWDLIWMDKEPWQLRTFEIEGISLPQGGLYDRKAYLPNRMWRTPFKQHRFGEDVALGLSLLLYLPKAEALWYQREFRQLGNQYGTWFTDGDVPFNLKVTKAPANLLESSTLAPGQGSSLDPDVAASAALVDPTSGFVAGAGQSVAYAIGVENLITGTQASQVVLKAALPAGLNFVSANPTQSRMEDARTPVWEVGSLPYEGAPRAFDVIAQVDPSTAAGTLLNITATATTSSLDADPTNNQFSDWGLTVQQPGPDLVIGSDLDATALTPGEPVTFTIGLANDGNAPAPNSRLDLTVPTGITIIKTSPTAAVIPNGVHWDAGELAPGGLQTFTVDLHVDPGLLDLADLEPDVEPEYPLQFLMTAGSDSTDIDPASNQMQVDKRVELAGPDLLVALQAEGAPGPGVFEVGQEVSYTLHYANLGNRAAGEVSAALLLWPGLTLIESQPAPTTNELDTISGVRTLAWDLDDLSIGEEGVIELRLRVDDVPEVGSIIQANIGSDNIDLNPADNVVMETRYEAYAPNEGGYKIYLPTVRRQ